MAITHSVILFFMLTAFLLPPVLVLVSSKVRGYDKFAWTLVSFFLSWLGFLVFLAVHSGRPAPTSRG